MRKPDKPGTYRVVPSRKGGFMLSGVRLNGSRVKIRDASQVRLERMGRDIFGSGGGTPIISPIAPTSAKTSTADTTVDDWGLPIRVNAANVDSLNASLGVKPVEPAPGQTPQESIEEEEKRLKRAKSAKSIMELAGVVWASGSVWAGRRVCEKTGRVPVTPSQEQVRDLRDVTKDTFSEWFGDHEVAPWQMMILLSFGIPISMFLQSPKRKLTEEEKLKSSLKSVP